MKKSVNLKHLAKNNILFQENEDETNNVQSNNDSNNYVSINNVRLIRKLNSSKENNKINNIVPNSNRHLRNVNTGSSKKKKDKKENYDYDSINFNPSKVIKPSQEIWVKKNTPSIIRSNTSNYIIKKYFNKNNKTTKANINKAKSKNKIDVSDIEEIKDSLICYICLMKVDAPKMCPYCHHIACEKCLKNWFITKEKNTCAFCRTVMTIDKMVSVPFMNNIANLLEKITINNSVNDNINENLTNNYNTLDLNYNPNLNLSSLVLEKDYNSNKNSIVVLNSSKPKKKILEKHNTKKNEDYCSKHPDQNLYYYCMNCNKSYCRTCFVFFGEEKDKHNGHTIIDYSKYKSNKICDVKKAEDNLDNKFEEINAYIKRCEALKVCYETERHYVQEQIKLILEQYNEQMDSNIKILDGILQNLKNVLKNIENCQKEVHNFYKKIENSNNCLSNSLINKISEINNMKYLNSKEIDSYADLSKSLYFRIIQSELKKYEIKNSNYNFQSEFEDSKYKLEIVHKGNEVQIYVVWSNKDSKKLHNLLFPFIYLRRKNRNWECFEITEKLNYNGNNYLVKRFNADTFCSIGSYFKIKAVLYDSYMG